MYIAIIGVLVLLLFTGWLVSSFFANIIELIINLAILYAVCVRGYIEVEKEQKGYHYLLGILIITIIFLIARINLFSKIYYIWVPVLFLAAIFLFAQLSFIVYNLYIKKYKCQKFSTRI